MFLWDRKRWLLAAAAVVWSATVLHAALPAKPDISGRTSLAGELLIASPDMRDPFDHAVILLVRHSRDGALGIVINRPVESRPIATVLEALGADATGIAGSLRIFRGGPVDPGKAFVIHGADYHRADTIDIDDRVAMSDAAGVLRDLGQGKGPRQSLLAFGYAGWAPAQLDDEIQHGAWIAVPEDPALVFDDDRAKVWTDALALHKTAP